MQRPAAEEIKRIRSSGEALAVATLLAEIDALREENQRLRESQLLGIDVLSKENERLSKAIGKFLELPNLKNRIGPWKDVNQAVQELISAFFNLP